MTSRVDVIQGAPIDAGAEAWRRFMMPLVTAAQDQPWEARAQFYAGMVLATFGSMAADFGHSNAVRITDELVSAFKQMDQQPAPKH
jgi:hypothetical protein